MIYFVKGLEKSKNIISVCLPTFAFLARSSTIMRSWVSQDFSRKPCCRSYMIPCSSRCFVIFDANICSKTLKRMHVDLCKLRFYLTCNGP